ncbi:MAG TPA: hypothetical protein P5026_07935 [Kiritimatiellia bacterium]|nr:hypothetical protein [Kiritimatiellia bacterium]HRU10242.1 hypothetical protein [Thermoanaerobaculia bacterium]
MSVTVQIDVDNVAAARDLFAAAGPVTPAEREAVGAELARLLQRHLRQRDASNAHAYPDGGRRSHFWRKAAESVSFKTDADSVTVSVTHQGAALRYAGAPDGIRPVNAKAALAIPAHGSAYGRLPGEFSDLRLVVFKSKNKAALVRKPKKGGHLGQIMFWLVKKTKPIIGDKTVLPSENVILGLAAMRIRNMRSRASSGSGGVHAAP